MSFWQKLTHGPKNRLYSLGIKRGVAKYRLRGGTSLQHISVLFGITACIWGLLSTRVSTPPSLPKPAGSQTASGVVDNLPPATQNRKTPSTKPFPKASDSSTPSSQLKPSSQQAFKYVFVIAMENEPASAIYGNSNAPYINQLAHAYASASNFNDPLAASIPSEPHYVWLEAGTNAFSDTIFTTDNVPSQVNSTSSSAHLTSQMSSAKIPISWSSFQEGLDPATTGSCPIYASGFYAPKHDPFVFFQDVAGNPPSSTNKYCADHHKAYDRSTFGQLLTHQQVAQYNFTTPNLCNDMHGANGCGGSGDIARGDQWLQTNLPPVIDFLKSHSGVVFVVWDEAEGTSNLTPFLAVGPTVKTGYVGQGYYTLSSVTKTIEEIYGLPLLPTVSQANDLRDLFKANTLP